MTREHIKQMLPYIQAFADGKTIQKHFHYADDDEWVDDPNPDFNPTNYLWRIKPEPKYRPFKSKEECWAEMQKHTPFGWVYDPCSDSICQLQIIDFDSVCLGDFKDNSICFAFDRAFEELKFMDGTSFGIKEE